MEKKNKGDHNYLFFFLALQVILKVKSHSRTGESIHIESKFIQIAHLMYFDEKCEKCIFTTYRDYLLSDSPTRLQCNHIVSI